MRIIIYACPICDFTCKTSMVILSDLHNKNYKTVHNVFCYFHISTVQRDLKTTILSKRIIELSKKMYLKIDHLPTENVAKLPDFIAFEVQHCPNTLLLIIFSELVFATNSHYLFSSLVSLSFYLSIFIYKCSEMYFVLSSGFCHLIFA